MTQDNTYLNKILFPILLSFMLAACGNNTNQSFGYGKNAPDEFAVITKPPLILPPDYSLRPPAKFGNGKRKGNVQQSSQEKAQQILLGKSLTSQNRISQIEKNLLTKANALNSSDDIRTHIEKDGKTIIRKGNNFVENLLFNTTAPQKNTDTDN